ncbi:PiggyBac transposable element-derived protein 4 [Anthophora quadrimaculata]
MKKKFFHLVTWMVQVMVVKETMYHFDDKNFGISGAFEIENKDNEYEYFIKYFDEHMITTIVDETNTYHECSAENDPAPKRKPWVPTNVNEMYSFLAIILSMPHIKKHKISDYWSTDPIIARNFISKYTTRDRFTQLLHYIHFADNNNPAPPDNNDKLWKIRTIFEKWNRKCSTFFHPFLKLVIDESLILFIGRLHFKQFIPSKRHRFGIKIFVLCDCETGIVLKLLVYIGSEIDIPRNDPLGVSGAVIKKLMINYEQKGHVLYTDNWYTSPKLAIYLDQQNTGLCGTVKKNRKHFPKFLHRVARGTCERKKCGNVMVLTWKDKRDVLMLSTFYQGVMNNSGKLDHRTGEHIWKPDCGIDYTQNMRMIDKCDMQLAIVECVRKSVKWYKKLFFHLVDVAMLNAYNMFLVKTGKTSIRLNIFIRKVVQQILEKHGTLSAARPGRQSMEVIDRLAAMNFMERHSPVNVPPTGSKQTGQKICHVCSHTDCREKKRKYVTTWCAECKVGLCMDECYKIYHTRKNF